MLFDECLDAAQAAAAALRLKPHEKEDIVVETALRLHHSCRDKSPKNRRNYLFCSAKRCMVRLLRQNKVQNSLCRTDYRTASPSSSDQVRVAPHPQQSLPRPLPLIRSPEDGKRVASFFLTSMNRAAAWDSPEAQTIQATLRSMRRAILGY